MESLALNVELEQDSQSSPTVERCHACAGLWRDRAARQNIPVPPTNRSNDWDAIMAQRRSPAPSPTAPTAPNFSHLPNAAPPGVGSLPDYSTTEEVAERYRKSPATIRYWRHIGYGPLGVKAGTRVLYARTEIERFDRELALAAAPQA